MNMGLQSLRTSIAGERLKALAIQASKGAPWGALSSFWGQIGSLVARNWQGLGQVGLWLDLPSGIGDALP